ncbi:MAG: hypothetical protein KF892_23620 [Rhizobacter sp.]|nr:hypothetical protein [Rhizobacter sp.]
MLLGMAENPNQVLHLANVDYQAIGKSKLEVMATLRSLHGKGLVRVNEYDDNLASLTDKGRDRALEIHRQRAA